MPSSLNGTGVTFNDATTLQSGNIPAANLGSGTANSSTFLRGDKTWQSPSGPPTFEIANTQTFTASGTWTKPGGFGADDTVVVVLIGGGGSGGAVRRNNTVQFALSHGGGGGGVCVISLPYSEVPSSVSVTVGSGGASRSATNETAQGGISGGDTIFGTFARATGGLGGSAVSDVSSSGANDRPSRGVSQPFYGNTAFGDGFNQTGGLGRNPSSGTTVSPIGWGLTGGGGAANVDNNTSRTQNNAGGTGRLFGDGGEGRGRGNGFDGVVPGGGGGGASHINANCTSGAGARGEAVIYVVKGRVSGSTILGVTL